MAGSPFALKTGFLRYAWTPRVPGWGQVLGAEHLWGWQCGVADMKRVGTHRGDGRAGREQVTGRAGRGGLLGASRQRRGGGWGRAGSWPVDAGGVGLCSLGHRAALRL